MILNAGQILVLLAAIQLTAAEAAEPIRVMTFNIRYGTAPDGENAWPHRKDLVVKVIKEEAPDLLGVQEALREQLDVLADELPEYDQVGVGRNADGGSEYSAILYRRSRFDVSDAETYWLSDTPEEPGSKTWGNELPRICTWVRLLDRTNGQRLAFFNTHWDHQSQPARLRSGEMMGRSVAESAEHLPTIVTGDFNATPDNTAFVRLLEVGQVKDSFREVHQDEKDIGTFNGFGQRVQSFKIDAVLINDRWDVKEAEIVRTREGDRYPSDHFPVIATVTLREQADSDEGADKNADDN